MHIFALLLSRQLKEVALDKTGLAGFYDVQLEWTPGEPVPAASGGAGGAEQSSYRSLVVDGARKTPSGN